MQSATAPTPPPVLDDEAAGLLRADLLDAGYTVDHLAELLGDRASAALHRGQVLPADLATAGSADPAAVLARLFVLARPVDAAAVDTALPRTGAAGLLHSGLADRALPDGALRATCDLRPYGDERHTWWLASDLGEAATDGPLPTDHVLGVGGASTTLSSWTPRPQVDRALDLGTGGGVQALHLSTHAGHVVATDLSTRALAYARLTAALNDLTLDVRQGSLLEPVAGQTFDLVVSNPPFVITPRLAGVPLYEYRDGGAAGDALVGGLVDSLAAHLRPGGIAQLLANWELREGEDWHEHVEAWLEGTGLDAWVVQREVQDVAEYAETWVRDGGHRSGSVAFERLYGAWLADFASRGVESVGFGVVTLHRPTTPRAPWRDLVDVRTPVSSPMGPTVLAGLRARTWLAEHGDDDVLDVAWQVADDVTEERVGRPGAPDPAVIQVRQGGGLGRVLQLDTLAAGVVGACDGDLTARQLCAGLAVLTDTPPAAVETAVVPVLRELVKDGLLR
ncbi:N5-glutamine methyltransferase family protein [Ornithinimicrobium pekingense]|uniref:N5-glutamine methyltransferase family protein n=1 Tax=Ornithinimicrobium pekingense TaxID=384677 RepID=UPI00049287C3|nr:class I SAM-dependent methyltransferase [Ornithinimicrobium pekingense]